MGQLGDNLEDYYAYQLLDEVIRQFKSNEAGDIDKLEDRMTELNNLLVENMENKFKEEHRGK